MQGAVARPRKNGLTIESFYSEDPDSGACWLPAGATCGVCWGRRGTKKYASAANTSGTTVMISMVIITPVE